MTVALIHDLQNADLEHSLRKEKNQILICSLYFIYSGITIKPIILIPLCFYDVLQLAG